MVDKNKIYKGDCQEVLKQLPDNSIDSVVTDPPYELGFMGKSWDATGIAYNVDMWKEVLRVLKPGGHLLSFGGTRTYHRMACAIEDAGFEIRDQVQWLYGSGFPKSMDIGKAIDKKAGVERPVIGSQKGKGGENLNTISRLGKNDNPDAKGCGAYGQGAKQVTIDIPLTAPATKEAQQWEGWGTALKPANEPICLARKPLSEKTVAENVLKWGTGGLNIDKCRVEYESGGTLATNPSLRTHINGGNGGNIISHEDERRVVIPNSIGRWPANIILDEIAAQVLDEQSGTTKSTFRNGSPGGSGLYKGKFGDGAVGGFTDSGGASRFFYVAKASKKDRGLGNNHPTVKPTQLMQYLVRMVTPPGGVVLDPFSGSGSTIVAAKREGFYFIGIEKEEEYVDIAKARVNNIEQN